MKKRREVLYIFNLENTQSAYAKCLEFIAILQGHTSAGNTEEERLGRLRTLAKEIDVSGMFAQKYAKNYYEQPLEQLTSSQSVYERNAKKVEAKNIAPQILRDPPFSRHFHIRVHLAQDDAGNASCLLGFHYLGVFLQGLDFVLKHTAEQKDGLNQGNREDPFKRVSVFVVPATGDHYPFKSANGQIDSETYRLVSTYLRLLAKRYTGNIFGVIEHTDRIVVRALDFHRPARLPDCLPLIPLDQQTYPELFDKTISLDEQKELFSLRKNGRFANANHTDPYKALGDYIMETAYTQFVNTLRDFDGKAYSRIKLLVQDEVQIWCKNDSLCRLAFTIFLFTFRIAAQDEESVRETTRESLAFAKELSAGLRQIAQNTLQHSACHEGVFSFFLQRPLDGDSNQEATLQVLLSDFNDQQSFVDNFIANLCREAEYTYNQKLKECYLALSEKKESITIGHFFGEYSSEKPSDEWINFRRVDSSAHIGLLLFALVMQRCKGSLLLATGMDYSSAAPNCYSHSYGKNENKFVAPQTQKLPGTQLALTIPIGPIENLRPSGLGQLNSSRPLREEYDSFSLYMNYHPHELAFSNERFARILADLSEPCGGNWQEHIAIADPVEKFEITHAWKEYWTRYSELDADSNSVYFLNVATLPTVYLESKDGIEILIKGFFDALNELCQGRENLLLALVNAPKLFLETFRQITISISANTFPPKTQIYVIGSDLSESIHLMGNTFAQAIENAYMLSLEHGNQAYSINEVRKAQRLADLTINAVECGKTSTASRPVCPFDAILPVPSDEAMSLFDASLRKMAESPMDEPPWGYKLENTHMRLGSKVHIRSFFEMAFLFYRTSIANRVAFEILRKLGEASDQNKSVDLLEDNLLFYGYASYSKALLTSMLEILKAYRKSVLRKRLEEAEQNKDYEAQDKLQDAIRQIPKHLAFASYQHNLQSDFHVEDTELYFNFYDSFLGKKTAKGEIRFNQPVKIVQIVPISSTLTTFTKMENRMQSEIVQGEDGCHPETVEKYTVFWVTDKQASSECLPREETEGRYWAKVKPLERKIYFTPACDQVATPITYLMRAPVIWEDPLQCELCYPENVIAEVPLMETDQTSTVPTQQLHGRNFSYTKSGDQHRENDERLLKLEPCVTYGHIRREKNHFQFYFETQNYFNIVSEDVHNWLKSLREKEQSQVDGGPILNIIFSPEHATNIGFAQYVNSYYFGGNAEIVCVNESKEFRSNFKCEHVALSKTIKELLATSQDGAELPVQFYFVDDTIITGETFFKAVSFLHSLIPIRHQHKYPTNLIKKCFLLVDRLSTDSKRIYVKDVEEDFCSFLHIDLSNMRVQGDSCVGCKLELNAQKLLKRSATENIERYWAKKVNAHKIQSYSQCGEQDGAKRAKAFQKLVLAHITQNVLFYNNEYFDPGRIYDSLLVILAKILGVEPKVEKLFQYDYLMETLRSKTENILELIKDFLKLVSRPFFSFDFKVKLQVLTFLLIFAEFLINDNFRIEALKSQTDLMENKYKSFLFKDGRIDETFNLLNKIKRRYLVTKDKQIDFLQDCIIDNLVELRSTYMMRKTTIAKLIGFLSVDEYNGCKEHSKAQAFWMEYVAGIHQILDCNSDETRSLWLEYLLISGNEYREFQTGIKDKRSFAPRSLFETLTNERPMGQDSAFYHFCYELFLQNNRVLFDGIESSLKNSAPQDSHSVGYCKQGRMLDKFQWDPASQEKPSKAELALFQLLADPDRQVGQYKVTERYKNLLNKIIAMAKEKYRFEEIDIALLTSGEEDDGQRTPDIERLDIVSSVLKSSADHHFNKYRIKKKLAETLQNSTALKQYGYQTFLNAEQKSMWFFVYFKSYENSIIPVYLYFRCSCPSEHEGIQLALLLRDIFSYRNRLLKMLKNDFAGDTFSKFAHTWGERSILAHEKATSHNTTGDDRVILDVFLDPKATSKYRVLDSDQVMKWLLLHTYNNAQIAKLFNRSYGKGEEHENADNFPDAPPLYLGAVSQEKIKTLSWFERPLRSFSDLRLLDDGRFTLLDTVVTLNTEGIKDAQFLERSGNYYNVEYFKIILIDIIISAMKFATSSASYLERVDTYLEDASRLRHEYLLQKVVRQMLCDRRCVIDFTIEDSDDPEVKYLVISNRVNKWAHNLFDWQTRNKIIQARLASPIDHADGHMSLLAICQYIEGLDPMLCKKTSFEYCEKEGRLLFVTKLPVIGK